MGPPRGPKVQEHDPEVSRRRLGEREQPEARKAPIARMRSSGAPANAPARNRLAFGMYVPLGSLNSRPK